MLVWYIRNKVREKPANQLLFTSKEGCEGYMGHALPVALGQSYLENPSYEAASFEISDKCACENMMQTTMVLLDFSSGAPKLMAADNYTSICNDASIPWGVNIEEASKGRYQMMSLDYFQAHYSITQTVPD